MTSADLDPVLVAEARQALGARSNREALEWALRGVVLRQRQLAALTGIAGIPLEADASSITYEHEVAHEHKAGA